MEYTKCNLIEICDITTLPAFPVAILLISKFCCFNNLSMKNQFFQNTKSKNQNFVFPPKPSESTLLCRHFAPLIVRIGSRSSENGTFEVWKLRHAWILRFSSFFDKEGRKAQCPLDASFENFNCFVLRAQTTDFGSQHSKMTALLSTFRTFWRENKILIFSKCISRFSIFSNNKFAIYYKEANNWCQIYREYGDIRDTRITRGARPALPVIVFRSRWVIRHRSYSPNQSKRLPNSSEPTCQFQKFGRSLCCLIQIVGTIPQ